MKALHQAVNPKHAVADLRAALVSVWSGASSAMSVVNWFMVPPLPNDSSAGGVCRV